MSLVPADKIFHPCSPARNRRHSTLGLGDIKMKSSKSQLDQEVMMEEEEQEDIDQSVIEVAEGEDGDKIYLEVTEKVEEKDEETNEPVSPLTGYCSSANHRNPRFLQFKTTHSLPLNKRPKLRSLTPAPSPVLASFLLQKQSKTLPPDQLLTNLLHHHQVLRKTHNHSQLPLFLFLRM